MTTVKLAAARYGKDRIRVFRIVRNGKWHEVVEYTVCALLEGDIDVSYTKADNSPVVATDSIKNTVYIFAKQSANVLQPETFALELGLHFVTTYSHIHKAFIDIKQHKWSRIPVDGKPFPHAFTRDGEEVRVVSVEVDATAGKDKAVAKVTGGMTDLLVLKSTGSAFEGFVRDEYTTLAEVSDRIFSTSVTCSYTLSIPSPLNISTLQVPFDKVFESVRTTTFKVFATDESASVQATMYNMCNVILADNKDIKDVSYSLPNKHYFAVDLSFFKGIKNLKPGEAEVFMPVSDPSGLIKATVARA